MANWYQLLKIAVDRGSEKGICVVGWKVCYVVWEKVLVSLDVVEEIDGRMEFIPENVVERGTEAGVCVVDCENVDTENTAITLVVGVEEIDGEVKFILENVGADETEKSLRVVDWSDVDALSETEIVEVSLLGVVEIIDGGMELMPSNIVEREYGICAVDWIDLDAVLENLSLT